MSKRFFNPDFYLCIQSYHCTLKYLLFSKSKKRFHIEEAGEASFQCKTALHKISNWSQKYPTQALIPTHQGAFLTKSRSPISGKLANQFLKRKIEEDLLKTTVQIESFDSFKNQFPFFYYPKKTLDAQEQLLSRFDINVDCITPACFGAYHYLLKNDLTEQAQHWMFVFAGEIVCFHLKKHQLLDGFAFPLHTLVNLKEEILKIIFHLKEHRSWKINQMFICGELNKEGLNALQKQCSVEFSPINLSFEKNKTTDLALELTKYYLPQPFFYPLNFSSAKNAFKKSISKNKKLTSLLTLILFFCLGAQTLNWALLVQRQKTKNIALFTSLQKNNPLALPQAFKFKSSYKDLKVISCFFTSKKRELANMKIEKQAPPIPLLLNWLTQLRQELVKKEEKTQLALKTFTYKEDSHSENTLSLKCVFEIHPSKSLELFDEIIKTSPHPYPLEDLSTSFHNGSYEATFKLHPIQQSPL